MEVNLFFNDDKYNSNFINFCTQSKKIKFIYQKLSKIKLLKNNKKIIVLQDHSAIDSLKNNLKKNLSIFSINTIFFLPRKYNEHIINISSNIINYPIKFIEFENNILNIFMFKKTIFMNLELRNDSTLYNNNNKNKIHLTEIESKIIFLLFKNDSISKKVLNKKALNQSPLIDSKSLDSHLYRLRRKLTKVDSKRKIILSDNQNLKVI